MSAVLKPADCPARAPGSRRTDELAPADGEHGQQEDRGEHHDQQPFPSTPPHLTRSPDDVRCAELVPGWWVMDG